MSQLLENPVAFRCSQIEKKLELLQKLQNEDEDNLLIIKQKIEVVADLYLEYHIIKKLEGNEQCMKLKLQIEKIIS